MNLVRKSALAISLLAILALGFVGSAHAYTLYIYPDVGATAHVVDYTGPAPSGMYYVTPLAAGSAAPGATATTIHFMDDQNNILFTNLNMATEFGTVKTANLSTAYFFESSLTPPVASTVNSPAVVLAQLADDLTLSNGLGLSAGTLILAFNVIKDLPDGENNESGRDYVLAASLTAPTPLPAAAWLLGSGLLGLVGFKRRRQAA